MDMLSQPQSKKVSWPNAPAKRGEFYGVADPVWPAQQLVVMSNDTWLDFGTLMAKQRETMSTQNNTIIEQRAVIAQLTAKLNDVTDRLEATRTARKKEKLSWLGLGPKVKSDDSGK